VAAVAFLHYPESLFLAIGKDSFDFEVISGRRYVNREPAFLSLLKPASLIGQGSEEECEGGRGSPLQKKAIRGMAAALSDAPVHQGTLTGFGLHHVTEAQVMGKERHISNHVVVFRAHGFGPDTFRTEARYSVLGPELNLESYEFVR
jgi:hypothetical protein